LYYNKFTYINQQRRRLGRILIIYPDAARASPFGDGGGGGSGGAAAGVPTRTVIHTRPSLHHSPLVYTASYSI